MKSIPSEETANAAGMKPGIILILEGTAESPDQWMKEYSNVKSLKWPELKSTVKLKELIKMKW